MIRFSCQCGHRFSRPVDAAGTDMQCRACGRLLTVPHLDEVEAIDQTGGYKLDELDAPPPLQTSLNEARRVFGRNRLDLDGSEIDLRPTLDYLAKSGVAPDAPRVSSSDPNKPVAPRYDPFTGELIREVQVAPTNFVPRKVLPPAPPKPKKRRGFDRLERMTPLAIIGKLMLPENVFVMFMVLCVHLFGAVFLLITAAGMIFVIVLPTVATVGVLAHWLNVIDETGPRGRDELPRLGRDLNSWEDIWGPFFQLLLTLAYCYGPALFSLLAPLPSSVARLAVFGGLAVAGTFFLPAVLLTASTSGSLVNLSPIRVVRTALVLSEQYVVLLIAVLAGVATYFAGFVAAIIALVQFAGFSTGFSQYHLGAICLPLLLTCIIVMHYAMWLHGQAYRVYQPRFPWAHQGRNTEDSLGHSRGFTVVNARPIATPPPAAQPRRVLPLDDTR